MVTAGRPAAPWRACRWRSPGSWPSSFAFTLASGSSTHSRFAALAEKVISPVPRLIRGDVFFCVAQAATVLVAADRVVFNSSRPVHHRFTGAAGLTPPTLAPIMTHGHDQRGDGFTVINKASVGCFGASVSYFVRRADSLTRSCDACGPIDRGPARHLRSW
jgi:hypothetical protein